MDERSERETRNATTEAHYRSETSRKITTALGREMMLRPTHTRALCNCATKCDVNAR